MVQAFLQVITLSILPASEGQIGLREPLILHQTSPTHYHVNPRYLSRHFPQISQLKIHPSTTLSLTVDEKIERSNSNLLIACNWEMTKSWIWLQSLLANILCCFYIYTLLVNVPLTLNTNVFVFTKSWMYTWFLLQFLKEWLPFVPIHLITFFDFINMFPRYVL